VDTVEGISGTVATSGAAGAGATAPADPMSLRATEIARALKAGEIVREEAARRLVADILQDRLRIKSKKLTEKIAEQMQEDPRLNQTLQRIWSKG
jgi:hypothetical protein